MPFSNLRLLLPSYFAPEMHSVPFLKQCQCARDGRGEVCGGMRGGGEIADAAGCGGQGEPCEE